MRTPDGLDEARAASLIPDDPNVWTDGSLVTSVSFSGAGFYAHQSEDCWGGRRCVMLIVFALRVRLSLAGVSTPFLGLCSLFRELKCGVSCWLCSLFLLFI